MPKAAQLRSVAHLSRRAIHVLLATSFLATACARVADVPGGLQYTGGSSASRVGPGIPCELLTTDEVELAMNAAAQGSRHEGRPMLVGMKICSVGSVAESEIAWGVLSEGADERFRTYRNVNSPLLKPTEINGYRAVWDKDLRTLLVLRRTSAFGIRVTLGKTALGNGIHPDRHLEETARILAARALSRLR